MVLSTTKKCQAIQSITNNTCILGGPKKGGLITMQGRNPNLGAAITSRAPYCCVQTNLGCIAGLAYLRANNLMTMNPQCSGGVPHRMYRGCRSSDPISGSSAKNPSGISITIVINGGIVNPSPDNAMIAMPTTSSILGPINLCAGVYQNSGLVGLLGFPFGISFWTQIGSSGWYTVLTTQNYNVAATTSAYVNNISLYCLINCSLNQVILFQSFENDLEVGHPDVAAVVTANNLASYFP
jgi:hypothetical protein